MRCLYCHNPDTWAVGRGTPMTAGELISEVEKVREFLKNGGITVSGGEPMLQFPFIRETAALLQGIGIYIDTCGNCGEAAFAEMLELADGFKERLAFDISDGSTNFYNSDMHIV